jgi:predicted transcriptional regulator
MKIAAKAPRKLARMDRGEKLPAEVTMTFEEPSDLIRVLSAQRVRVLLTVRIKPRGVSDLARILKRDRKAVGRDVKILESSGLVRLHSEPNPGHGVVTIVEPIAARYQLIATI